MHLVAEEESSTAMNNLPALRPPPPPHSPSGHRSQSSLSQTSLRSDSSLSSTSNESGVAQPAPLIRRSPYAPQQAPANKPSTGGSLTPAQSVGNLQVSSRQQNRTSMDSTQLRTMSPALPSQQFTHRARQHSQGFFEPSLPHATANPGGLSASQIAAQAAMHHVSPPAPAFRDERKRSYGALAPISTAQGPVRKMSGDIHSPQPLSAGVTNQSSSVLESNRKAASLAANAAFPTARSPLPSPGLPAAPCFQSMGPAPDKEPRSKSSKMKLFSKPKTISLSKDKESKVMPSMPSPSKMSLNSSLLRGGFANASTTSLADLPSTASSIYSSANASTSTLVPVGTEREKEKRLHFLSRQKQKFKEEPNQLPLSSAHSNSQATNPEKPQTLYNFTPDSPGLGTFPKSMSGFDLRHGGRALREKRKEERPQQSWTWSRCHPTRL